MQHQNRYYIASGEGEVGTIETVVCIPREIRRRLRRERCNGDRWAVAALARDVDKARAYGEPVNVGAIKHFALPY